MRGLLILSTLLGLASAAEAQPRMDPDAEPVLQRAHQLAALARATPPPRRRPGDLRKQRWWVQQHLIPWMRRRGWRDHAATTAVFRIYRGAGPHNGAAQELTARIADDFARALLGLRARARTAQETRLYSSVLDAPLRESAARAILIYGRCARTAEGLHAGALLTRCRERAAQLEEETTRALGDRWRPGPRRHTHRP